MRRITSFDAPPVGEEGADGPPLELAALAPLSAGAGAGAGAEEASSGTVWPTATVTCFPPRSTSILAGVIFKMDASAILSPTLSTLLKSGRDPEKNASVFAGVSMVPTKAT